MDNKKYELTDETITIDGLTLYRIRAIRDFGNVKKGDLGGYIAAEKNLSHGGKAWVYDNACVFGDALVEGHAHIHGNAQVYGGARIGDNACICDHARVYGHAKIYDNATVCNNACVCNNAQVRGHACVCRHAYVFDNAFICDNAWVSGNAQIHDSALICNNAMIESTEDYMMFGPFGSRNGTTTIYRTRNGAQVICGCFRGTLNTFREMVKHTHGDNRYAKEYLAIADIAELRFGKKEEE